VLLTPRIDIDLDIPEEEIQQLPKAISGLFHYIRGVYFNDYDAIFILDPEKLKVGIQ
jgi:chemotaxis signal transduction protein